VWRVSCASWRGKAWSGVVALVSTFCRPRVLDHWGEVYGAREGKLVHAREAVDGGVSPGERREPGEAWSCGNVRACSGRALVHGTAARARLRRALWVSNRVAASVGSGGEVVGVLQTRWGGAARALAHWPRRGGKRALCCSPLKHWLELGNTMLLSGASGERGEVQGTKGWTGERERGQLRRGVQWKHCACSLCTRCSTKCLSEI
jgi:hypothetical protein